MVVVASVNASDVKETVSRAQENHGHVLDPPSECVNLNVVVHEDADVVISVHGVK